MQVDHICLFRIVVKKQLKGMLESVVGLDHSGSFTDTQQREGGREGGCLLLRFLLKDGWMLRRIKCIVREARLAEPCASHGLERIFSYNIHHLCFVM